MEVLTWQDARVSVYGPPHLILEWMAARHTDEPILRAKYLDWCSARVAERFLRLTPDEIYELAHGSAREGALDAASSEAASEPPLSYGAMVQRATKVLAERLDLPAFEEWVAAYLAEPGRYDEELLGFWKDVAGEE